jgi:hypothetical protein
MCVQEIQVVKKMYLSEAYVLVLMQVVYLRSKRGSYHVFGGRRRRRAGCAVVIGRDGRGCRGSERALAGTGVGVWVSAGASAGVGARERVADALEIV